MLCSLLCTSKIQVPHMRDYLFTKIFTLVTNKTDLFQNTHINLMATETDLFHGMDIRKNGILLCSRGWKLIIHAVNQSYRAYNREIILVTNKTDIAKDTDINLVSTETDLLFRLDIRENGILLGGRGCKIIIHVVKEAT